MEKKAMSTTATLDNPTPSMEAGTEATIHVTVRNDSDVVEQYALRVVGAVDSWAQVVPDRVRLYPGHSTTAAVHFRPPRSSAVLAGEVKFGVHVLPTQHPDDAVLPEGTAVVLPFLETTAELMPRMSRGKIGARHNVAVDNRGNVPISVELTGSDPGDLLEFALQPPELTIEPGTVGFTEARVRPAAKIWRGVPATHVFAVTVTPAEMVTSADGVPVRLDGSHVQDPVLPWRTIKTLAILLLLAVALTVGWHLRVEAVRVSDPTKAPGFTWPVSYVLPYESQ
jgi:hypothetical protein